VCGVWEKLPFKDEVFNLVIFDPPHRIRSYEKCVEGKYGVFDQIYTTLDPKKWVKTIYEASREFNRVLKTNGYLVFKWNDSYVSLERIISLFPMKALIKNVMNPHKKAVTYWVLFQKIMVKL